MIRAKAIGIEEILSKELLEDERLTPNMKLVLAQAILYSGLDKNIEGEFFRSNRDFSKDTGLETSTLRFVIQKLVNIGLLERIKGSRQLGASVYKLDKKLISLNPFSTKIEEQKKVTAPRIQNTEDEGNLLYKLPSDSIVHNTDLRVEIKENFMKESENPLDGFSSSSFDDEMNRLFDQTLSSKKVKPKEVYQIFAEKGQEQFNWLCRYLYENDENFYKGTTGSREHVARNQHLTIPTMHQFVTVPMETNVKQSKYNDGLPF